MKILSIDPGYERLGIAIIEKTDSKEILLYSNCFKTSSKSKHHTRLKEIGEEIENVIKKFSPESLAIETLFFNTNQKTALMVSEARGVVVFVAHHLGLSVSEFTPLQVKVAVTGHGRSDKKAIARMIPLLISYDKKIRSDDEIDAIAIGLTFFAHKKYLK